MFLLLLITLPFLKMCCCCCSVAKLYLPVSNTMESQMSLSFTVSCSLLKLMSIESEHYPTISSSIARFSYCPRSFPPSGSFPKSQLFTSGGQSIEAPASASVLPMNMQCWFCYDWLFDLLTVQWTLKNLLQHQSLKASIFQCLAFFMDQTFTSMFDYWKYLSFVDKVMLTKWCLYFLICSLGLS